MANLAYTKWWEKPKNKMTETLANGYSFESIQRELSKNTNMTGSRWFSKIFASLCFERK